MSYVRGIGSRAVIVNGTLSSARWRPAVPPVQHQVSGFTAFPVGGLLEPNAVACGDTDVGMVHQAIDCGTDAWSLELLCRLRSAMMARLGPVTH